MERGKQPADDTCGKYYRKYSKTKLEQTILEAASWSHGRIRSNNLRKSLRILLTKDNCFAIDGCRSAHKFPFRGYNRIENLLTIHVRNRVHIATWGLRKQSALCSNNRNTTGRELCHIETPSRTSAN
jgi:hypothetical protein